MQAETRFVRLSHNNEQRRADPAPTLGGGLRPSRPPRESALATTPEGPGTASAPASCASGAPAQPYRPPHTREITYGHR